MLNGEMVKINGTRALGLALELRHVSGPTVRDRGSPERTDARRISDKETKEMAEISLEVVDRGPLGSSLCRPRRLCRMRRSGNIFQQLQRQQNRRLQL